MPTIYGILESALYVTDLEKSSQFYRKLFGFELIDSSQRLCAMGVAAGQILLLFKRGASSDHDGAGRLHLAFSVPASDLDNWERFLSENGIAIENRKNWDYGGRSIYFRDPDQHLLELATPGTWRSVW